MNVNELSASFYPQINPQATPAQQVQNQLQQIQQSLGNGNLAGAQQSYAALQQTSTAPQGQVGNSVVGNSAFAALGQALQNGDLTGARDALAALQQNRQQTPANAVSAQIVTAGTPPGAGGNSTFHVIA